MFAVRSPTPSEHTQQPHQLLAARSQLLLAALFAVYLCLVLEAH